MNIAIIIRELSDPMGAEKFQFRVANYLSNSHKVDIYGLYGNSDEHTSLNAVNRIDTRIPGAANMLFRFITSYYRGKLILGNKYDLVISQHAGIIIGEYLQKNYDIPHVTFIHDHQPLGRQEPRCPHIIASIFNRAGRYLRRITEPRWYSNANAVFVPSKYMSRKVEEYHIDTSVMYAPVPAPEFTINSDMAKSSRAGSQQNNKSATILHITPTYKKGIHKTIKIASKKDDWKFKLVGKFDSNQLRQKAEDMNNVEVLGYIPCILKAYRNSDILIIPSLWEEPGATVATEAGMCAVPPVVANRGGLPELVADERQVVQNDEIKSYINSIEVVLENYSELSESARSLAYTRRAEKQYEFFESVIREQTGLSI
jgi:glycosyltransferase involved in cell wall biosynthesis